MNKYDYERRARFWMNAAIDMWETATRQVTIWDKQYFENEAIEYSGRATDNYRKARNG